MTKIDQRDVFERLRGNESASLIAGDYGCSVGHIRNLKTILIRRGEIIPFTRREIMTGGRIFRCRLNRHTLGELWDKIEAGIKDEHLLKEYRLTFPELKEIKRRFRIRNVHIFGD